MSLTRTIKFEVVFPGLRKTDRLDLYRRLWGVQSDLTRAANHLISALWLLTLGQMPHPTKEGTDQPVSLQSLAYQGLSGKWQPHGFPLYVPYEGKSGVNPRASGGVLSETSAVVLTRLKTDTTDIRSGKKSLATFRQLPIHYRGSEVAFDPGPGTKISLSTFAGRKNNKITICPRKIDASQRKILEKCMDGAYKHGSARLQWVQRTGQKGRWMFSLSWTDKEHQPIAIEPDALVAGVDLGIEHAIWISYVDQGGGARRFNDVLEFPASIIQSIARRRRELRSRSLWNRAEYGLREGHGVRRKLRSVDFGAFVSRTHETMIRQLASAAVQKMRNRGATVLVLEDHKDWSVAKVHTEADGVSRSQAAQIRKSYFRWHQGAMRVALEHAAQKAGMTVQVINPANTSRICSSCGTLWANTGVYRKGPVPVGETDYGRVELRRFVCSCGADLHADRNAAINIARRGLEARTKKAAGG